MKISYIFVALIFISTYATNAQKRNLTLEEAVNGRYQKFAPKSLKQLQWCGDQDQMYAWQKNDSTFVYGKAGSGVEKTLLSLEKLNGAIENLDLPSLAVFPAIRWESKNMIRFNHDNHVVRFNLSEGKINQVVKYPSMAQFKDFSSAGSAMAYTIDNNLFIAKGGEEKVQVSSDSLPGIVNGQYVHRREFGISKGTFWSPSGKNLAYYRKDETMVKDYPLVNFMTRQAEPDIIKYPMAGMKSHHVTVRIYNVETQKTVELQTGEPLDHYLTNISWGPDEKYIYIAELNREQNHMHFNQYEVESGKFIKTLFEEKHPKYVEPQYPATFSKNNKDEFYWMSRTNGYFHIYKYNTEGKLLAQITQGNWEVTDLVGLDAKEQNLFFIGTKTSPIERHIYKVDLRKLTVTCLDKNSGTHRAKLSAKGNYLIDQYSSKDVPNKIELLSSRGKRLKALITAEDPANEIQFGANEVFTIKAADDSTDLYCRMIKPANFDASKTYPVIVYVYGGPHAQLVNNTWHNSARWWQYYMAQKGYIAFTVDNRGSANRGLEFENVIHRHLGDNEMADQMKGIEYLQSLPFVDADRIGVHGWSFGGFMTTNLMLTHPETFKVGVAGGSVIDWKMYEIMYGERYMDTPQENPEGYKSSNLLNRVDNLQGKLLAIHGAQDDVVVMQHNIQLLRKCITNQKQIDFFVYPIAKHNVRGVDRVHLMQKVSEYFENNL